jgi:ribosomal protein S27E
MFTAGVVLALIVGFYLFTDWFSKATGYVLGEDQKAAFANCLKANGGVFYETVNCADCEKQRGILGEGAYEVIPRVTCGDSLCQGLRSVPAWEVEGNLYYGVKTYKELDGLSHNCELIASSE